ncbi:uncharacterized protein ACA1_235900 [Acanthamoeba castellanii str. Neff]|uniref:Uncharacterized protein n=1 Tax=Acanthamoeba castellanii (strain ATCC 30010 / Neff) TaxID=1257118 RepID=L8H1E7_ACACF|nr:uncharacterized protein ACA1_235900 [Acanthamoeba castellanii str. Neff]ELR19042.1 hypothetical protein ACA1_235900 [Acanthamoeba castellanii str. Neff]
MLLHFLLEELKKKKMKGVDLPQDALAVQRLRDGAEAAKKPLVDRIVAPCESVLQVSPPCHRKLEELRVVGGSPAGFVVLVVVG